MLRRRMFGLVPTTVTRKIVGLCILLLLVLTPAFVACAGLVSTPASIQTPPSALPAFQIAELEISPAEVSAGEKINIAAKVTNTSDTGGIYPAELRVNNISEALKNVTVPAGETRTLSFSVSEDIPGTYEVTCGGLAGQFAVVNSIEQPQANNLRATVPKVAGSSCCGSTGPTTAQSCCPPKTPQPRTTASSCCP